MNTVRIRRNTSRVSRDGIPRGRMTVRTAEPNVRYTARAPAMNARIRRACMRGSLTDPGAGCTAIARRTGASEDRGVLILSRSDVQALLDLDDLVDALAGAMA